MKKGRNDWMVSNFSRAVHDTFKIYCIMQPTSPSMREALETILTKFLIENDFAEMLESKLKEYGQIN